MRIISAKNNQSTTEPASSTKSIINDKALPNVLSFVFHPLLMPVAGTLFILFFSGLYITMLPAEAKNIILMIVGLCTLAMPVVLLLFYRTQRWISNFYISERRERIIPLVLTAIFYYIAYRTLHSLHTPFMIQKFVLASAVAVFLTSIISVGWKISIHGVGIGGITGMLAALTAISFTVFPVLLISIILSGVVGYARIRLNAHTPGQYYAGVLLGFSVMLGIFFLL